MTDQRHDDVLTELEAALDVRPSPEFAARVRQRVHAQPVRPWWSRASSSWAIAAVASAASIAVVAWVVQHEMARLEKPVRQPVIVATATPPAVAPRAPKIATPSAAVPSTVRPRTFAEAVPVATKATDHTAFEVLVPPGEAIALQHLLVAIRQRRAVVPEAPAAGALTVPEIAAPSAISVQPITVEPLPGSIGGGGGRK